MTDSIIERMAKAMCEADQSIWLYTVDEPCKDSEGFHGSMREMYLAHARAALSALEEPSEAMVKAGMTYRLAVERPNIHDTAGIFAAMIKAAQGEE